MTASDAVHGSSTRHASATQALGRTFARASYIKTMKVRLLKHTAAPDVPDAGSYEVRFPDGRPSVFFYWDDNAGRRAIIHAMRSKEAELLAKELARAEEDKLR
jgi:hypothetical protein